MTWTFRLFVVGLLALIYLPDDYRFARDTVIAYLIIGTIETIIKSNWANYRALGLEFKIKRLVRALNRRKKAGGS